VRISVSQDSHCSSENVHSGASIGDILADQDRWSKPVYCDLHRDSDLVRTISDRQMGGNQIREAHPLRPKAAQLVIVQCPPSGAMILMKLGMTRRTHRHQVVRLISSPAGPEHDMMQVQGLPFLKAFITFNEAYPK